MKKEHSLNVLVDQRTLAELKNLAQHRGVTMATIVRGAIHAQHAMVFGHTPCCADGNRCFVPQMHTNPTPAAPHPVPHPSAD